jgi:hypothetical protein
MKHCKEFKRKDGSTVTIIQIGCFNPISKSLEIYSEFAKVTKEGNDPKFYHPTPYNPSMNGLSVDEYIKSGRKGLISVVRPHELLKTRLEFEAKLV